MPDDRHPHRHIYDCARWRNLRKDHLKLHPFCIRCREQGMLNDGSRLPDGYSKPRPGLVVDHIVPHKGDEALAFDPGNLQTLCRTHHDFTKRLDERRGYSLRIGADGVPVDPRHPNLTGASRARTGAYGIPSGLEPFRAPVWYVVGAPAAGKSHWIGDRFMPGDRHIDWVQCVEKAGFSMRRRLDADEMREARSFWRHAVRTAQACAEGTTFIERLGQTDADRQAWVQALGERARLHVCWASESACLARLRERDLTGRERVRLAALVRGWHRC